MEIRLLSQNKKIFFPQTSAEAVLVKLGSLIYRLDQVLEDKVSNIESKTLIIRKNGPTVQAEVNYGDDFTEDDNGKLKLKWTKIT